MARITMDGSGMFNEAGEGEEEKFLGSWSAVCQFMASNNLKPRKILRCFISLYPCTIHAYPTKTVAVK